MSKYVCGLDEEAKNYARDFLNETDENREEAIESIRGWLRENPRLHGNEEDAEILAFLRGCKFDLDRTKTKMTNYYMMRGVIPEWFAGRDPTLPKILELVRLGVFVPLRQHHQNRLVVVIKTAAHDPHRHDQNDVFKAGKMILDVAAREDERAQIYGVTALFDMAGISLAHARQLKPQLIKKAVHAWQNYHCRPKQLEFVNAPLYINVVLNVFKSFMSDKLKSRVNVHFKGLDSLHTVIAKSVLPVEYGGYDGPLQDHIDFWENKLIENKEWFVHDEQFKAEL